MSSLTAASAGAGRGRRCEGASDCASRTRAPALRAPTRCGVPEDRRDQSSEHRPPAVVDSSAVPAARPPVNVMLRTFSVPERWKMCRVIPPPLRVISPPPSIVYVRVGFGA